MTCAVCGEALPEGARFCPNCGAVVGATLGTDERKMVTVLFADMVDSTGLARRHDPERARAILGRFFEVVSEELLALRGRPEKFIGDAVMAVFGLPTVSEDDALRAVRAGLAIRDRLRRLGESFGLPEELQVRVGVESGEAAMGIGPVGQLLVTGPVVNRAARLQTGAQPGEVLVGATTFALTENAVTYGTQREFEAKGFDGPLVGSPVDGLSTRSARRTIPFVGRASELTILRESLVRSTHTGEPVLATVLGEPGIGKSRLGDELIASVPERTVVLDGRATSVTDTATFAPAATIVGDLAGIEDDDPPDLMRKRLRELVGRTAAGEDAERVVHRLELLFGTADQPDESAFVQEVSSAFVELIDALARDIGHLLFFEDAHVLKPPMLDLIERLGTPGRRGQRRAMVLALARSELLAARPEWAANTVNAVTLRLGPLSSDESVDLVRQAGSGRIDDIAAAQIADRSGGNPFFIVETTGMICANPDGSTSHGEGLPPTVQAVVSARLDALAPRLRELARRASAFFVSFDLEELRVVDPEATEDELRALEEAEIVVREGGGKSASRWRVRHATVKEVAYASLPKRERVQLHQRISDQLVARGHPSWAAEHLELAAIASLDLDPDDRSVPERAVDALVGAGNRARKRMESRTAIDYYERALALAGDEDGWGVREGHALAGMGEAHYWLGEYPSASDRLERAEAIGTKTNDPATLALALRFLGDIAINVEADLDKAERLLDRSLAAAEELGDPWAIVRTLLFAGWVPWTRGRNDEADAIWRRALEVAAPNDTWARIRALNSLSVNETTGSSDSRQAAEDALALSDEACALAESIGDPFSIAMTAVQLGRVLEDLGRAEEAVEPLDRGIAIFEELGARWEYADALAERGIIMRELGRLDRAEDDLRRAIGISEEIGELQLAVWTWRALAVVAERRGDTRTAEERHRKSREAQERFERPKAGRTASRT